MPTGSSSNVEGQIIDLSRAGAVAQPQVLDSLSPTLIIGLGGSGYSVVWWLRRMFYERYGKACFPMIAHLVIDTDSKEPKKERGGGSQERNVMDSELRLNPNASPPEFVNCQLGRDGYRQYFDSPPDAHPHIFSWLDTTMDEFCFGDLTVVEGCGMQRPFGRLSFFHHFRDIERAIAGHLNRITQEAARDPLGRAWAPPRTKASTDPDRLEVIVVHSLAGGTGAGMFIDVCYLIRQILRRTYGQKRTHITDIAVLPGWLEDVLATSSPDQWTRVQANAYACLMEMEHLSMRRWDRYSFLAGGAVGDRDLSAKDDVFEAEWELGTVKVREAGAPWDTCYLIDNRNRVTDSKLPQDEVFKMVAEYLMLDFEPTDFGAEKRSFRSNAAATHLVRDYAENVPNSSRPEFSNIYSCRFSSFGVAQIYFDRDRIRRALAYGLAEKLVQRHIADQEKKATDDDIGRQGKQDLAGGEVPFSLAVLLQELFKSRDGCLLDTAHDEFVEELARTGSVAKYRSRLEGKPLSRRIIELNRIHEEHLIRPEGAAYISMKSQVDKLAGPLRERLTLLCDEALARFDVTILLRLIDDYEKRLGKLAQEAQSLTTADVIDATQIAARLSEIPGLWHRRGCAVRIEFPKAAQRAWEERTRVLYHRLAGELIRDLMGQLIRHLDNRRKHYQAVQNTLITLRENLHQRFLSAICPVHAQRNVPLSTWTKAEHYDQALQQGLQRREAARGGTPDASGQTVAIQWGGIETEVYRDLARQTEYADCGDRSKATRRLVPDALPPHEEVVAEFANVFARGCYGIVGEFQYRFNAVDEVLSDTYQAAERTGAFRLLAQCSDPYINRDPVLADRVKPGHRRILSLDNPDEAKTQRVVDTLGRQHAISIPAAMRGEESAIVLYQELAGLPLFLYARLDELSGAYESVRIQHYHINYRGTKLHLPAIDRVTPDTYRDIQRCAPNFLFAMMLGGVEFQEHKDQLDREGGGDGKRRWVFCLRCHRGPKYDWRPLASRYDRAIKEVARKSEWMGQLNGFCEKWFVEVNKKDAEGRAREMVTVLVGLQMLQYRIRDQIEVTGTQARLANPIYYCAEHYVRELCEHLRGFEEGRRYLSVYDDRETGHDAHKIDQAQASCFRPLHEQFPVPVVCSPVPSLSSSEETVPVQVSP